MPDESTPVPGLPGTELRAATLPDGTAMTLAVAVGLPQDEVDLLAARIWQGIPDE